MPFVMSQKDSFEIGVSLQAQEVQGGFFHHSQNIGKVHFSHHVVFEIATNCSV